jgi:DNA-binding transcriptional LysR family regulator
VAAAADPFADLRRFLRVVELGSLRAGAADAGLEPSSVSRRLTALERRLGTKLLERSGARSRPTEAGRRYYDHLRSLLGQMDVIEAEIAGETDTPKGLLRVHAPIDFGQRFVTRWLLDFRRLHPQVDFELILSSRSADIASEGADLALRIGRLQDSVLLARKLADVPRALVASPGYLSRRGCPETPG